MLVKSTLLLISTASPLLFHCRWRSYVNTSKSESCLMDGSSVTSLTAFSPWTWWKLCRSQGTSGLPKWLEKKASTLSPGGRGKRTSSCRKCFIFFPWLILESGNCIFFISWCVWSVPFFSHTRSAVTGPGRREGLCWGTLSASQTARLTMLCSISHPHGSLTPGTASWWISVLHSAGAVALWWERGGMQVAGARKEKQVSL